MKCQEERICAHWAEKNLPHKQKKILMEAWNTICQLVGSLLEKMILVKAMEGWKILENFNQIENLWKQNVRTQYPEN